MRDGLFADDGLIGARCGECVRHHFPSAPQCPYCASQDVVPVTLSPVGALWGWTAVTAAPPGYRGDVPFGFGVVELPEGVRVITRLTEPDPGRLSFGDAMRFEVVTLHTDDEGRAVTTYAFAPAP